MPRILHVFDCRIPGLGARNKRPISPDLETNDAQNHPLKSSTTYQPFSSKKNFISALSNVNCTDLEESDICPICWEGLHSTAEEQCAGPPIRMPCCNKPFGKACISLSTDYGINLCPNCKRQLFANWQTSSGYAQSEMRCKKLVAFLMIAALWILSEYLIKRAVASAGTASQSD
ncbi:hypothetical protein Vi05172_g13140 [Venturia inaequalis]|nr:hypothetical protein Vi05172_g13140 [Venturia inaequalis]